MKYIARINGGKTPFLIYKSEQRPIGAMFTIADTASDEVYDIRFGSCFLNDYLGFSQNATSVSCAIVANSSKTVKLHRYIKSFTNGVGLDKIPDCADRRKTWEKSAIKRTGRCLAIDTGVDRVNISGLGGAVCVVHRGVVGFEACYNLYDLFIRLCRECDLNIMQADEVWIHNSYAKTWFCLRLVHTAEANRFYTKMLMDVMSK